MSTIICSISVPIASFHGLVYFGYIMTTLKSKPSVFRMSEVPAVLSERCVRGKESSASDTRVVEKILAMLLQVDYVLETDRKVGNDGVTEWMDELDGTSGYERWL